LNGIVVAASLLLPSTLSSTLSSLYDQELLQHPVAAVELEDGQLEKRQITE